jgi:hypothetical protein
MCTRGLLILAMNERINHGVGLELATRIIGTLNKILARNVTAEKRKNEKLA